MHAVQAAAVAYHGRSRFDAQPPALSALMAAAHLALLLLARAWGATRLTWTAEGAARAIYGRPQGTSIAIAKACRCGVELSFQNSCMRAA